MSKLAIMGGHIIDPHTQFDNTANLYIADGKIVAISPSKLADFNPDKMLDAKDCIVCPGFVDLNASVLTSNNPCHFLVSNLDKAARAGITHLGAHAFTNDGCFDAIAIACLNEAAKQVRRAKAYFIGPLTKGLEGERLNELKLLKEAGCIGFTNGRKPILNTLIKRRCYDYASMLGLKIFMMLDDPYLSHSGCMHEGEVSFKLGLPGLPAISECLALTRELLLIQETGIKAHFCRISAGKTVELLEEKVTKKLAVTSDVAIHQLFLTEQDVQLENGLCHVRPPFRTKQDADKLQEAVSKGSIDAITTDHIFLPQRVKHVPFQDSEPGIASWPLLLPLMLKWAKKNGIPLIQALSRITSIPAAILGINAGHLKQNNQANVVIFKENEFWYLSERELKTFGTNNPFEPCQLQGRIKATIIDGEVIYSE